MNSSPEVKGARCGDNTTAHPGFHNIESSPGGAMKQLIRDNKGQSQLIVVWSYVCSPRRQVYSDGVYNYIMYVAYTLYTMFMFLKHTSPLNTI